jgi:hypothetical protein
MPSPFGRPVFIVRSDTIEVFARPRILSFGSIVMATQGATMRLDQIGPLGLPIFRRDCIRLSGTSVRGAAGHNSAIELAVTPDRGIEAAWQALLAVGVVASP